MDTICDTCAYLTYDDEEDAYLCDCQMDEDDFYLVSQSAYKSCPYYRNGDEYRVVRRQG